MCQWGIIGAPGHPIFLKILYHILEIWVGKGRKWDTSQGTDMMLDYTGPYLISRVFTEIFDIEFNYHIYPALANTMQ